MYVLVEKSGEKTPYRGRILGTDGDTMSVDSLSANGTHLNAKNGDNLHLQIVVDNALYNWEKIKVSTRKDGTVSITVVGDPVVVNRRRFPRMPLSNPCTILAKGNKTVAGHLENISAGGFAFSIPSSGPIPAAKDIVHLEVENFDHIVPNSMMEGIVIRASVRDGKCIVGCRMVEDSPYIKRYVSENYSEN